MCASPAPPTEVIDLSSGDDSFASGDPNDTSVHIVSETIRTDTGTPDRHPLVATPGHVAAPSARRISAAICLTPDTPDLPSPSALLGVETAARAPRQSLLVRSPTLMLSEHAPASDGFRGLLTRREALEMPSSPPVAPGDDDDDDDVYAFIDERVSPELDVYPEFDTASAAAAAVAGPPVLDMGTSMLGRPRVPVAESGGSAASTDVLDSSSSEDEYRRLFGSQRRLTRRTLSMDDEVLSISTDPSRLPSAASRALHSDGPADLSHSSDSLSIPWLAGLASNPALLQTAGGTKRSRREREAERREERERQKLMRLEERAARERQRLVERGIVGANRKKVDVAELLRDMTVVADPGLLGVLGQQQPQPQPEDQAAASDAGEGEGAAAGEHPVFGLLEREGVAWRAEPLSPAAAVRWEMRVRRKWDSALNLYVPLAHARVARVRSVAVVVVGWRVFGEMVAADRLAHRLEIWRASLAVRRLLVVVVGLQRQMRRAATAETREFARQMRLHLKDRGNPAGQPRARRQQQQGDSAAPASTLTDEDVEKALLKAHMTCPWAVWATHCADARALGKILLQTTMDVALSEYSSRGDGNGENSGFVSHEDDENDDDHGTPAGTSFVTREVVSALHAVAVRSGADLGESWVEALALIPKVTRPVARSIAAVYPTPRRLMDAWEARGSLEERELMLAQVTVAGAAVGGRRLGAVMSQRIYRLFNEADPTRPYVDL
ncbi:hypothetical protein LPJ53_001638 [Coemansia erecta]|uniref:ERCC4 domain-containing protein n=1 Tax=Coemansia erecta TaxID=147472 RepID=A0A9W7XZN1_9FUNG|nr:hypothetical protein LPJ53_001638 [Coemansia erecta]